MSDTQTKKKIKKLKSSDVPTATVKPVSGASIAGAPTGIDPARIKELEDKWEEIRKELATSVYRFKLDHDLALHFRDEVVEKINWKSYEAFAIEKILEKLDECIDGQATPADPSEVEFDFPNDIFEVTVVYLRNYYSSGRKNAVAFRKIADKIAPLMKEQQDLQKKLQGASVDLEAARHGLTTQQYLDLVRKSQQQ